MFAQFCNYEKLDKEATVLHNCNKKLYVRRIVSNIPKRWNSGRGHIKESSSLDYK